MTESIIEPPEKSAEAAYVAIEIAGAFALLALIVSARGRAGQWPSAATMIVLVVAAALVGRAAFLGGQIRHTEIRSGQWSSKRKVTTTERDHAPMCRRTLPRVQ